MALLVGRDRSDGPWKDLDGSGIRGRVLRGCDFGECREDPIPTAATQRVKRTIFHPEGAPARMLAKRFRSEKDGTFEIELAPGQYLIEQDPSSLRLGLMSPTTVDRRRGRLREGR